ncbi:MAG: hypothetical protein K0R82_2737 [Flavipsychrobacter sp.]|nr:hypothetical protein [Flavipsychrobacter sp.]
MKPYLSLIAFVCWISCVSAQQVVFDKQITQEIKSSFDYIATADINGDGLTDVVGATTFYFDPVNDYKIFLWLQDAQGQLQAPLKFSYNDLYTARSFAVGDLYNDGTADVLVGIEGSVHIYSWINNGLVRTDSLMTHPTYSEDALTTADFDDDGLMDIGVSHWGGERVTVIYQKGETTKWDKRHYTLPANGYGHVLAGKFGPLQQTALIKINGQSTNPLMVLTFDKGRTLQNRYDLAPNGRTLSAAIVRKGPGKPNELWVVHGGNQPSSKISIWRGLQPNADTSFGTYDCPEAIQADNLDCDDDDEPVVVHGGWHRTSVYGDTVGKYYLSTSSHIEQDGLALGDINNDGRIDAVVATGISPSYLAIFYNITSPCWPAVIAGQDSITKGLSLYPNPTSENITVRYPGDGLLAITDAYGKSIYQVRFHKEATVDLSSWASGIYF